MAYPRKTVGKETIQHGFPQVSDTKGKIDDRKRQRKKKKLKNKIQGWRQPLFKLGGATGASPRSKADGERSGASTIPGRTNVLGHSVSLDGCGVRGKKGKKAAKHGPQFSGASEPIPSGWGKKRGE